MKKKEQSTTKSKFVDNNLFFSAIGSFCASLMFFINMKNHKIEAVSSLKAINGIIECFKNLSFSLNNVFFQITIICAVLFILSKKIAALKICQLKFSVIFSAFIAVMWTFGKSFAMTNSLYLLVSSSGQLVKSIMFGFGCYFIIYNLVHLTYYLLEKGRDFVPRNIRLKNGMNIRLNKFFDFWNKHPFAFPFVFLLIVWAPYTLISYPGNMCSDAYIELCQFFGEFTFTSHHPPFYTLLIGYFVKFGRVVFDSANIGLFLYIIFQYIISAAVMAYTLFAMQKMNSPMWLRMLSIFIYGFMPHFISYVALMQKDMLYCMAFVTFMTQIMLMFVQKKKFWTVGNIAVTVLSMTFALLLRNNGKHVILPLVIVILVKFLWDIKKKAISSEEFSKCVFMLVLPLVLFSAATSFMVKKYNISDGSIKEVLSLPFQQTARYVRDYSDEVTPNERAAIDKLLDYDNLGELYDEEICDPVKSTFKNDYEKSDLVNYFKVWFKQFTKHPWCYFEATLNQNYFILYPFDETLNMYTSTTGVYNLSGNANKLDKYRSLGITECKPLTSFQSVFINLYRLTSRMPFLGLLCSNAFYILLLLCLLIYAINKKNYSVLLVSIPLVMTILVIIASPVISTHPRYAFPISYLMPLFTGFYLYVNSNKKEKKMQAKAKS